MSDSFELQQQAIAAAATNTPGAALAKAPPPQTTLPGMVPVELQFGAVSICTEAILTTSGTREHTIVFNLGPGVLKLKAITKVVIVLESASRAGTLRFVMHWQGQDVFLFTSASRKAPAPN